MTLRWRLTIWVLIILCACLILSDVVIHTLLRSTLTDEVDEELKACAQRVLYAAESGEVSDLDELQGYLDSTEGLTSLRVYVQVRDRDAGIQAKSSDLGDQELPMDASLLTSGWGGEARIGTITTGTGAKIRLMASPLYFGGETMLLEVGHPLEQVDAVMGRVRWGLAAGFGAAVVLALILGRITVRRSLAPVVDVAATAEKIESGSDLGRRVGYDGPMDEIGRLATTFDRLVERLDGAFQSQKHFVSDASHELRSPLTVLQGNLGFLKREIGEDERLESIHEMELEIMRMSRIVNDLLVLAEAQSGPAQYEEDVSLKQVLHDVEEWGRRLAGSRQIVVENNEDLYVAGDTHNVKQMLTNLVENAIRHTPDDSTITLSLAKEDGWARMAVADNGPGIPAEHLPHILERFYVVDKARSRSGGGAGLGLAIVNAIAEQHGGQVTVTSKPGRGSTFTVWLRISGSSN